MAIHDDYGAGINRNIVECKLNNRHNKAVKDQELIETLWNVNPYV